MRKKKKKANARNIVSAPDDVPKTRRRAGRRGRRWRSAAIYALIRAGEGKKKKKTSSHVYSGVISTMRVSIFKDMHRLCTVWLQKKKNKYKKKEGKKASFPRRPVTHTHGCGPGATDPSSAG